MSMIEITAENFEREVKSSALPVLALFYATPWCWPCKAIAPVAADIAEEFAGAIKAVQINTEKNEALSQRYNVTSIPTLMLLRAGSVLTSIRGLQSKSAIRKRLNAHLERKR